MANQKAQLFKFESGQVMLLGTECLGCQHRWFPALYFGCEKCGAHGEDLQPRYLRSNGTVLTFTTVPEADGGSFTLAQLALDDGPAIRAIIDPPSADELRIGDKVEAISVEQDGVSMISFRRIPA